jgi:hypothetical protein
MDEVVSSRYGIEGIPIMRERAAQPRRMGFIMWLFLFDDPDSRHGHEEVVVLNVRGDEAQIPA